MFRQLQVRCWVVQGVVWAAILGWACPAVYAQKVPFKVKGAGMAPQGLSVIPNTITPHDSAGQGTHLGKYTGDEGKFEVLTINFETGTGTFKGSFVFVAATRERFTFTYGDTDNGAEKNGEFVVIPVGLENGIPIVQAYFYAEFNPDPQRSTRRFRNVVAGSFWMVAVSEPFQLIINPMTGFTPPFKYAWEGEGWIEYKQP